MVCITLDGCHASNCPSVNPVTKPVCLVRYGHEAPAQRDSVKKSEMKGIEDENALCLLAPLVWGDRSLVLLSAASYALTCWTMKRCLHFAIVAAAVAGALGDRRHSSCFQMTLALKGLGQLRFHLVNSHNY